jgi:hypothetical protein
MNLFLHSPWVFPKLNRYRYLCTPEYNGCLAQLFPDTFQWIKSLTFCHCVIIHSLFVYQCISLASGEGGSLSRSLIPYANNPRIKLPVGWIEYSIWFSDNPRPRGAPDCPPPICRSSSAWCRITCATLEPPLYAHVHFRPFFGAYWRHDGPNDLEGFLSLILSPSRIWDWFSPG